VSSMAGSSLTSVGTERQVSGGRKQLVSSLTEVVKSGKVGGGASVIFTAGMGDLSGHFSYRKERSNTRSWPSAILIGKFVLTVRNGNWDLNGYAKQNACIHKVETSSEDVCIRTDKRTVELSLCCEWFEDSSASIRVLTNFQSILMDADQSKLSSNIRL